MKKLILGLLLTVGVSGISKANSITEENVLFIDEILISSNSAKISEMAQAKVDFEDYSKHVETLFIRCYQRFITRSYDCDGGFTSVITYSNSNAPCGGNADNSIVFNISYVDGCPDGGG